MKKILTLGSLLLITSFSSATELDTVGTIIGAVGGILATDDDQSSVEKALITGGAALAGNVIGGMLGKKQREKEFEMYQLGRFHEAWVRAETDWYDSTLDRRTGRPPAFDGYWAMDIGMPNAQGVIQAMGPQTASVPANRDAYIKQFWTQLLQKNKMDSPEPVKEKTHSFATMPN
jgi:hypothetical protein